MYMYNEEMFPSLNFCNHFSGNTAASSATAILLIFLLCKSTFPSATENGSSSIAVCVCVLFFISFSVGRNMLSFCHAGRSTLVHSIHSTHLPTFHFDVAVLLLLFCLRYLVLALINNQIVVFFRLSSWCMCHSVYKLPSLIYLKFNFKSGNRIWLYDNKMRLLLP